MNISQTNLYGLLDVLGCDARVGKGHFLLLQNEKKLTKEDAATYLNALFMVETKDSMYAMCQMEGKLGVLFRMTKGLVSTLWFIDLRHKDASTYNKSKDWNAMLQHIVAEPKKTPWVLEEIDVSNLE